MAVASASMRFCLPVFAALVACLAGCGGGSGDSGPKPVSLALDFTPNAAHAPIYSAVRTGADKRHGIPLRILGPGTGPPDSLKLVTSGRADVGVLDIHDLGLAAERGADVVAVGALVHKPLAAVIAKRPHPPQHHTHKQQKTPTAPPGAGRGGGGGLGGFPPPTSRC